MKSIIVTTSKKNTAYFTFVRLGSDEAVVILASLVALLDVFFIVIFVPESLLSEQKMAIKSLTFQQVQP